MNKFHFLVNLVSCGIAAALTACAGSPKGYVISGQVEGLDDGTVVTLTPMSHDNDTAIAKATVQDGKFQFEGVAEEPICVMLGVGDKWMRHAFMLENTKMDITGSVTSEETERGTVYKWDVSVKGSPLSDKLAEFDARHDKLDDLYREMREQHDSTFYRLHALKGAERDAFKQTEAYKAAEAAEKNFFDTVQETVMGMVNDNKDSFWGPLLLIKYMSYLTEDNADYYNQLPDNVKNSFYGRKMKEELWPAGVAGEKVKEFKLTGDDGTVYDFAKLAEGKKYVLLDFWASWCGPCRKELPNVKKAYADYKDRGFEVVSISIDKDEAAWRKAVAEEQLVWPNFRDQAVADLFKVKAVPTVYLLDSEGRIVASNSECRGEALGQKLAELLPAE